MTSETDKSNGPAEPKPARPRGYRLVHEGVPLPPYYAAEMLRPLIGKTVWVLDDGGRVRNGLLTDVPWVKEDQADNVAPALFRDEKPLYLRKIVCIAFYDPKFDEEDSGEKRSEL